MNDKRITVKTALEMSKEKFQQMLEEQEWSNKETCEDKALEQFVRKPEESNLDDKIISTVNFILLFLLFCVICVFSVISSTKGWMEPYVSAPIAILSMIGIIILAIDAKKNNERNNKKYK